ncbi:pantetheine-phosphate adenylyltransferase [bacterium]|nr:pantetheine-phosphate adenylyltransferase [bacterium]RZP16654.1 MAG: pantetheine-phosphate adenylyltransferase [Candidatus Dadabacteria bacterium]|tara:strand:+ start:400 stop:888 length:489 start_codon:yes stop_codon:yes gene_type:complete
MKKSVIYPGSFDPLTNGHVNIIERASKCFDEVIIGVAKNSSKNSILTSDERVKLLKKVFKNKKKIKVDQFDGLLAHYVDKMKIYTILRGMRTVQDFEYELQMATSNNKLNNKIETIFMVADGNFSHISSSLIKDIVRLNGDASNFIPKIVEAELRRKLLRKR